MSSSLNSRIVDLVAPKARDAGEGQASGQRPADSQNQAAWQARRRLLLASAAWPVLAWSSTSSSVRLTGSPVAGLQRWGSGDFRRYGFLVYHATLWAGDDPQRPPLALLLDYKRQIKGAAIVEASLQEMRRFVSDEGRLKGWGEQLLRIFPDVRPGEHLLGLYQPDGAYFYQDERLIGAIREPAFAEAFFAIWLDQRTSAPALREALLRRQVG